MKKILIPTDFSLPTANALVHAIQLAKQSNAQLYVLHHYHVPILNQNTATPLRALIERIEKLAFLPFRQRLKKGISENDLDNISFHYLFNKQIDTKNILTVTQEKSCDILVLGAPSHPSFFDGFIGGINPIINRANCTVLVVPEAADYRPLQQIMYPTSLGTPNAALSQLNHFSKTFGATVKFLPIASSEKNTNSTGTYSDKLRLFKQRIQQIFTHPNYEVMAMKPTKENKLSQFVDAHNIDLLSLFQRPKNLLSRLFLHNFINKITAQSAVPVLIINERQKNIASFGRFNRNQQKLVKA